MSMMIHRCCGCGCEQVNFKQFDFSDGTLNWEAFLYSPVIATDGAVYAINYDDEIQATEVTGSFTGTAKTLTLPVPSSNNDTYHRLWSVDHYDSAGVSQGNSGWFDHYESGVFAPGAEPNQLTVQLAGEAFNEAGANRGMTAALRMANDDGVMCFAGSATMVISTLVVGAHDGTTTTTYYLDFFNVRAGTLQLDMDSEGTPSGHSPASFDLYDSAATVSGAISSNFGSNVTSVTVTGTSVGETGLKVVIEWSDAQHYMKNYRITSATNIGAFYARSLEDGKCKGYYDNSKLSSSYLNVPSWQDNGDLFRVSADTADATKSVVESIYLPPSTPPPAMTLQWTDNPLNGKTPINPAEASPLEEIEWTANGGIVGISFPRTAALSGPGSYRMSVITWNDDGTGKEDYDNSGNHWTGDHPNGLCIEDGGTSVSCIAVSWRDDVIVTAYGNSYATTTYGSEKGDPVKNFPSGSGSTLTHAICRGDFYGRRHAGFDSTSCAFADIAERRIEATAGDTGPPLLEVATTGSSDLIGKHAVIEGSGIYHSVTTLEIDWFAMTYDCLSLPNTLSDEHTQWRLRWVDGADTVQHIWMQETATLSDLNTELLSVFGTDFNGGQNVTATVASDASPISVPIYKRGLSIEAHGATSDDTDDEDEMETPAFFRNAGTTDELGYANMPELYIDIEDYTYGPAKANTFGAINWSTGATTWSRNFNASGAPGVVDECILHNGNLHVLSTEGHCGET